MVFIVFLFDHWILFGRDGPCSGKDFGDHYPHYVGRFWGQFWAARCPLEHSRHEEYLQRNPAARIPLASKVADPSQIYRGSFPRQLMVRPQFVLEHFSRDMKERRLAKRIIRDGGKEWVPIGQDNDWYLATANYLAVSYRRASFPDKTQAGKLAASIRMACDECGLDAYWLDEHCTGETWAQKNHDVYRIADVFRGAEATVIMLPGQEDSNPPESSVAESDQVEQTDSVPGQSSEWQLWGTRVWTFPEALLSKQLLYKLGDDVVTPIGLRQLANIAFQAEDRKEVAAIIDHYSGKDPSVTSPTSVVIERRYLEARSLNRISQYFQPKPPSAAIIYNGNSMSCRVGVRSHGVFSASYHARRSRNGGASIS